MLDSPLSVDNQEPFNVLGRPTEEPLIFRSVSEEKAGLEEGLVKAKDKQNEDPLAIIEGSEAHRDLEAVLAPRMTTEEEIESTLTQLQADQNVSPQQLEAAEIMALQKKDLLLERFRDSVNEEKKKVFKSQLRKVKEEAGDSVGGFISTWNTSATSDGSSNSTSVALPLESGGSYDFIVYWCDGTDMNHDGIVNLVDYAIFLSGNCGDSEIEPPYPDFPEAVLPPLS